MQSGFLIARETVRRLLRRWTFSISRTTRTFLGRFAAHTNDDTDDNQGHPKPSVFLMEQNTNEKKRFSFSIVKLIFGIKQAMCTRRTFSTQLLAQKETRQERKDKRQRVGDGNGKRHF